MKTIYLSILLLISQTCWATTYYVSIIGSNSYNGLYSTYQGGSDGPWLTIQHAADEAIAGDTVLFLDGLWELAGDGGIRFRNKGTEVNPITFKSINKYGAQVTLPVTGPSDAVFGIGEYSGDWVPYTPFWLVIDGFDIAGGDMHCIQSAGGAHVEVKNCKLHDSLHDPIKFNSGADFGKIHDNLIYNSGTGCADPPNCNADGIDITSSYGVEIYDNEVYDIVNTGIYVKKGSHNASIYRNIVHDAGNQGISLGESSPLYTSVAYNNLLYNIGWTGLSMFGCKDCGFYHNTAYSVNTEDEAASAGMRASAAQNRYGATVLINFNSGGTATLNENEIVIGATTGDEGHVYDLHVTSGTWAGGDASGYFYIKEGFDDNYFDDDGENLNQSGGQNNICTITSIIVDDKYCDNVTFKNNIIVLGGNVLRIFRLGDGHDLFDIHLNNNIVF